MMITCPNCNKEHEDGTKFCDNCGKQFAETIFCQNCGEQTSTEFAFCQKCGASLSEETEFVNETEKKKFKLPKFNIPKKLIAIGSACVAVVLVAAIVLSALFTGGAENNFVLYIKDKELFYTGIDKIKPFQLTQKLDDSGSMNNEELFEAANILGVYIHMTKDGKTIFYADKISESATIYCRSVNKPDQEPIKIDSEILTYSVSESGKLVTYLREDGSLYQHNLKDKEKIDSEVSSFVVSSDGKKIGYLKEDGGMYLKNAGKDKEKLDSDVEIISYINEAMNTVYYIKEDALYKKVDGKEKEKIASDIDSVVKIYDSGEIYYLKSTNNEVSLIDYIEDDMKESDAAMVQPQSPQYPSYWEYDTYSEYERAYDEYEAAYEAYQTARQEWYKKQNRDSLRQKLSQRKLENTAYTLCYYNGKEEKVLTDAYAKKYAVADENPVFVFSIYNQSAVAKVKLSEIEYLSEVEDMVEASLFSSAEKYIAVNDSYSVIDQTDADNFKITDDGKAVYFIDNESETTDNGELYKISVSSKAGKPELYDSDVYAFELTSNGKILYFKDVKDGGKGELYIDKQKVDYDVDMSSYKYIKDSDTIMYFTDVNDEGLNGTLKMFKNGKAVKIADDVTEYEVTPGGEILYLQNFSSKNCKGELYVYKNKKAQKIADDVVVIVPIISDYFITAAV